MFIPLKSVRQRTSRQSPGPFPDFTFAPGIGHIPGSTFVDGDAGDTLTYQVTGMPSWLSFNPLTLTNPFNPTTIIRYQLPVSSDVQPVVYDILGRAVAGLVNERKSAGSHTVTFDGSGLASGVCIYRLRAGDVVRTRTLQLLR